MIFGPQSVLLTETFEQVLASKREKEKLKERGREMPLESLAVAILC